MYGQPAASGCEQSIGQCRDSMTKPTLVIDPATGEQSYTKHPEKLEARRVARRENDQMILIVSKQATFWNGSDDPSKMHVPGEVRS